MTMAPGVNFSKWQDLIKSLTGTELSEAKSYLLQQRLGPLLLPLQLRDLEALYRAVTEKGCDRAKSLIIEAITTHETSFFRDEKPFEVFRRRLQTHLPERVSHLRVLCAGCSTGEEAYSVAMILDDVLSPSGMPWSVHGFDIAEYTLDKARKGHYSSLKGVPEGYQRRYFLETPKGHVVIKSLRDRVRFSCMDLMSLDELKSSYDFVFFRNVAIYFSPETRLRILASLTERMRDGGLLIIGAGETLGNFKGLKRVDLGGCYAFQRDRS